MANHVPDRVLERIDAFGEGLLYGDPPDVAGELRTDLRVRIRATGDRTATCVYLTEHTRAPTTLRGRGSFVTTIVDAVDERLRTWGVEPPPAYRYVDTRDGTHRYEGELRLP
ncbi:hypothetical protein BRC97_05955 [Halobacteriales archaeon QS_6_71_20]|nr:MAG: hypothetical protein BRC97_05955 [Halobacteriales archaeon QS_6_71_20]